MRSILVGGSVAIILAVSAACGAPSETTASLSAAGPIEIAAGGDFQTELQTALIEAAPGEVIQMPAGTFSLTSGLSLDVDGVTLKGAGEDATILDFAGQEGAGEGLLVTSDDVTLTGFTLRDTAGDGIKSKGADRITYTALTVEWSGEPSEESGAYGVYPVESEDVLVDDVTVRGASDAGIYVGQSRNIIVRNSLAEYNVAGIEIENSIGADVYDNIVRHNAGGILVFDLPDLPMVGGHSTRIFNNQVHTNNTRNFAPPGNIVATVPSGTGVIVLANENVQIFDNDFMDNRTAHVLLTAYQDPFEDTRYNPLPLSVWIKDNRYQGGGDDPQSVLADLASALGGQLPPIVWDGVETWRTSAGLTEPKAINLMIEEPETVGFVNLGIPSYPLDPAAMRPSVERPGAEPRAALAPITLSHASR